MKVAVFGKSGQVATELQRREPLGMAIDCIGRDRADFTNPEQVAAVAAELDADAIIDAVAYTAVDRAECEPEIAALVNAASVASLAKVAADRAIPLLHISTDYVFDGSGTTPHAPDAPTGPLGVYGQTKLDGENAVRAASGPHAILRTSWVFSAHGSNFVKTMLRLGSERDELGIVADQIGGPTSAAHIAEALLRMAVAMRDGASGGTYHFTGAPDTSWAWFARAIFDGTNLSVNVTDIPTSQYPTPAVRPLNSRLDCDTLLNDFAISRPDWHAGLNDVLKELLAT